MRQSLFRIVMTRVKVLRNRDPQTVRHRVGWLGVSFARFVACAALTGVSVACGGTESMSPVESGGLVAERRGDSAPFIGTWKLLRVERYDQAGEPLPDFVHEEIGRGDPLGYLMYDGEQMAVAVQQEVPVPFSGNVPTPEEALVAVGNYSAYFGPYSVDVEDGYVSHLVVGSLNPRGAGGETQPFYEFLTNQLVLTPSLQCPDSFLTDRGCGYGTTGIQLRNVWEKLEPSAAGDIDSRFFGFWQIDRVERRTPDGRAVPTPQYEQGYLIYMPSGYMMVQLMRPDRRPYEVMQPTATEAYDVMQSYLSYFGPFSVHSDEGVVVHQRDGNLNPNQIGVDASRDFEFRNGQLILRAAGGRGEGAETETFIYWDRLSAID